MLMLIIPRLVDPISIDGQVVAIHLFEGSFTLSNLRQILNVNEDIQDYTKEPDWLSYGLCYVARSHFITKLFWFALRLSLS